MGNCVIVQGPDSARLLSMVGLRVAQPILSQRLKMVRVPFQLINVELGNLIAVYHGGWSEWIYSSNPGSCSVAAACTRHKECTNPSPTPGIGQVCQGTMEFESGDYY